MVLTVLIKSFRGKCFISKCRTLFLVKEVLKKFSATIWDILLRRVLWIPVIGTKLTNTNHHLRVQERFHFSHFWRSWLKLWIRVTHQCVIEHLNMLITSPFISSRFSNNSEANASELRDNLEEMFPQYYMDGTVISRFFNHTRC